MDILGFSLIQVATFLLVLVRVGGIFTSAPIFGNVNVAPMVRVSIALALSFVFLPMAHYNITHLDFMTYTFAIIKETLIGVVMGFLASLMFSAIQMAAAFIDLQIGFGFASVVDPMVKERNAVIGQFYNLAATLLFLAMNGHHLMIRGLAESFAVLPLGEIAFSPDAAGGIMQMFVVIFIAALKIGAPVVGAIFLTDVALGILARTVPQLNVLVLGYPVKMAVGFLAVIVVLPMTFVVMGGLFTGLHHDIIILLRHIAIKGGS